MTVLRPAFRPRGAPVRYHANGASSRRQPKRQPPLVLSDRARPERRAQECAKRSRLLLLTYASPLEALPRHRQGQLSSIRLVRVETPHPRCTHDHVLLPRLDYSHAVYGAIKVLAASLRDFAILAAREPLSRFTQCSMQNFAVQDGGVSLPSISGVERLLSTWNFSLGARIGCATKTFGRPMDFTGLEREFLARLSAEPWISPPLFDHNVVVRLVLVQTATLPTGAIECEITTAGRAAISEAN